MGHTNVLPLTEVRMYLMSESNVFILLVWGQSITIIHAMKYDTKDDT